MMSQARYAPFCYVAWCSGYAVAKIEVWPHAPTLIPLCKTHLDSGFDSSDEDHLEEPSKLVWVYSAEVRWCVRCNWPAELCADWSRAEHQSVWDGLRRRTLERLDPWRSAIGNPT